MNIAIFNDLTTEEALTLIEKESEKYDGLYVNMDNKQERKFVKDAAETINTLLKKLERARIDKSKEFKAQVELEASSIKERLEAANKPLTELIDLHKEKRAAILAEEKRIEDARLLAIQIEEDHENAITLDKIRTFEIKESIEKQKERDEEIAKQARAQAEQEAIEAEERAEQAEKNLILAQAQAKRDEAARIEQEAIREIEREQVAEQLRIDAQLHAEIMADRAKQQEIDRQKAEQDRIEAEKAKLEANKKHVGAVRCEIKKHIMSECGINDELAVKIVKSLLKAERITINY